MSTTLSTTAMVARLQRKFPIGLGSADCLSFLQEAFRKIDQLSKGGFVWQVAVATLTAPAATNPVNINLPSDFDPGKTAWLRGSSILTSPTLTIIPYKPYADFYNQEHFSTTTTGTFSAWTYRPTIAVPGGAVVWVLNLAPTDQFPLAAPIIFNFTYHKVCNTNAYTVGPAVYFPTPDQFDSLILDLAESELARVYGRAGWEKIQQQAMQGAADMIDTYRTERYSLAGLSDLVMQAQERQADKTK